MTEDGSAVRALLRSDFLNLVIFIYLDHIIVVVVLQVPLSLIALPDIWGQRTY